MNSPTPFLTIDGLNLSAEHSLVHDLTFEIGQSEVVALVGESGSGKSLTAHALMGILPPGVRVTGGRILFDERDLAELPEKEWSSIRGERIAMVFQESMSALHPIMKIGRQMAEIYRKKKGLSKRESRTLAVEALSSVKIHEPERVLKLYPHELSGGMRQRVMIAMALASEPDLLIADEPTTALDVTVQAEILHLLKTLQREKRFALLFITHDLAVVAHIADRVIVLYAGMVMEAAETACLFEAPRHPYTRALLSAQPNRGRKGEHLPAIPGTVPSPGERGEGCTFATRCPDVMDECHLRLPMLKDTGSGESRCLLTESQGD